MLEDRTTGRRYLLIDDETHDLLKHRLGRWSGPFMVRVSEGGKETEERLELYAIRSTETFTVDMRELPK